MAYELFAKSSVYLLHLRLVCMSYESREDERRPVPKFASFRPKEAPGNQKVGPQFATNDSSTNLVRHEKQHSDKHRQLNRHEYLARTEGESHISLKSLENGYKLRDDPECSFVIDRVGDLKNVKFHALHRYTTPSYFRFGAGNVLGSPRGHKIDTSVSNEKGLLLSKREHAFPIKGRRSFWKASGDISRELKVKVSVNRTLDFNGEADYVGLSAGRRTKRRRSNDRSTLESSSSLGDDTRQHGSIEGKAKVHHDPGDQYLMYSNDKSFLDGEEESSSSDFDQAVQTKRIDSFRRVDADPTNGDAWLELIHYQDKVSGIYASIRSDLTNAEKRSNADVKLSMFEKALKRVSNPEARETLLLGMMEEAAKIWSKEKLSSHWESLLKDNSSALRLWIKYLDFKQTAFTSFKYEDVQSFYINCLNLLQRAQGANGTTIAEKEKMYAIRLYVVLRMTLFLRESGFSELALAAWQALLEYEFFRPAHVQRQEYKKEISMHRTISMFESFWDSEVPRVGEEDAEGWANYCRKQCGSPRPIIEARNVVKGGQDSWKSWIAAERRQGLLARKPARTIYDVEEDDPYRVILFSDIRPFLIDSPSDNSRHIALDAFLMFCHLPACHAEGANVQSKFWAGDGLLRNEALYPSYGVPQLWRLEASKLSKPVLEVSNAQEKFADDDSLSKTPFHFPLANYWLSSASLFAATGSWFSPFDAWPCSESLGPLDMRWVLQALKALALSGVGGDILAEFVLALELRFSTDSVRKTSKTLLRKQPSNLRLYNAYALVEYRLGNPAKGENVLITAINMSKKLDEALQRDSLLLWCTWISELLSTGNTQDALKRLMEFANEEVQNTQTKTDQSGDQGTKPALLRTGKALSAARDYLLSLGKYTHAALAMECLILFDYLKSSLSLSVAASTFQSNLPLLSTNSSASEHLHQSFAHLLYQHATHTHLFKPADIRSVLAESIAQFPTNTIFLSLFAWNEARFRIEDRVRSIINNVVLSDKNSTAGNKKSESVISHFFAIYTELHRGVTFGSNVSTIRSAFERAVDSESAAHCAALWKLYFLFEHSKVNIARAKAVFWRGLRACPWVKELYLLAFEYLRDALEDGELRGIHELMEEKGLRVHVELEDHFESMNAGV